MKTFLHILPASFLQAISELRTNMTRSVLSLLGITIGIFCIMSIKSAVDSLEGNIRQSFEKLGDDVLYVTKTLWNEDPMVNWWKYMRRPNPTFTDFLFLKYSPINVPAIFPFSRSFTETQDT